MDANLESEMELIVYIAFGREKTQKEAIEQIYERSYENVNILPFKNARENLQKKGLVERTSEKLRNTTFKSQGLDEDFETLADSKWFLTENRVKLDKSEILENIIRELSRT